MAAALATAAILVPAGPAGAAWSTADLVYAFDFGPSVLPVGPDFWAAGKWRDSRDGANYEIARLDAFGDLQRIGVWYPWTMDDRFDLVPGTAELAGKACVLARVYDKAAIVMPPPTLFCGSGSESNVTQISNSDFTIQPNESIVRLMTYDSHPVVQTMYMEGTQRRIRLRYFDGTHWIQAGDAVNADSALSGGSINLLTWGGRACAAWAHVANASDTDAVGIRVSCFDGSGSWDEQGAEYRLPNDSPIGDWDATEYHGRVALAALPTGTQYIFRQETRQAHVGLLGSGGEWSPMGPTSIDGLELGSIAIASPGGEIVVGGTMWVPCPDEWWNGSCADVRILHWNRASRTDLLAGSWSAYDPEPGAERPVDPPTNTTWAAQFIESGQSLYFVHLSTDSPNGTVGITHLSTAIPDVNSSNVDSLGGGRARITLAARVVGGERIGIQTSDSTTFSAPDAADVQPPLRPWPVSQIEIRPEFTVPAPAPGEKLHWRYFSSDGKRVTSIGPAQAFEVPAPPAPPVPPATPAPSDAVAPNANDRPLPSMRLRARYAITKDRHLQAVTRLGADAFGLLKSSQVTWSFQLPDGTALPARRTKVNRVLTHGRTRFVLTIRSRRGVQPSRMRRVSIAAHNADGAEIAHSAFGRVTR